MIDERFSASAFSSCGLDTQKARGLSEDLAQEIESEMQQWSKSNLPRLLGA